MNYDNLEIKCFLYTDLTNILVFGRIALITTTLDGFPPFFFLQKSLLSIVVLLHVLQRTTTDDSYFLGKVYFLQ